jgi:hypothetical protein
VCGLAGSEQHEQTSSTTSFDVSPGEPSIDVVLDEGVQTLHSSIPNKFGYIYR